MSGASAKEPSKNGSNRGAVPKASTSKQSRRSFEKSNGIKAPQPIQAYADNNGLPPDRVEVRYTVSREEWEKIEACAAFDKKEPMDWLKSGGLSWIEETLEAIRQESRTAEQIESEESKGKLVRAALRRSLALSDLDLSADEATLVEICGVWEQVGFQGFCKDSIMAFLEASLAEMSCFASGLEGYRHGGAQEISWAKRHYKLAAPIMARLGWDGVKFNPIEKEAA